MSKRPGECQVCNEDPDTLVVLPQARGNDKIFGCVRCAIQLGLYCVQHESPHTAFEDGLSACLLCIENESRNHAEAGETLLRELRPLLARDECRELNEWLKLVTKLTGVPEGRCLMRAVVGKALRAGEPIEAIQKRLIAERSIRYIF